MLLKSNGHSEAQWYALSICVTVERLLRTLSLLVTLSHVASTSAGARDGEELDGEGYGSFLIFGGGLLPVMLTLEDLLSW